MVLVRINIVEIIFIKYKKNVKGVGLLNKGFIGVCCCLFILFYWGKVCNML